MSTSATQLSIPPTDLHGDYTLSTTTAEASTKTITYATFIGSNTVRCVDGISTKATHELVQRRCTDRDWWRVVILLRVARYIFSRHDLGGEEFREFNWEMEFKVPYGVTALYRVPYILKVKRNDARHREGSGCSAKTLMQIFRPYGTSSWDVAEWVSAYLHYLAADGLHYRDERPEGDRNYPAEAVERCLRGWNGLNTDIPQNDVCFNIPHSVIDKLATMYAGHVIGRTLTLVEIDTLFKRIYGLEEFNKRFGDETTPEPSDGEVFIQLTE